MFYPDSRSSPGARSFPLPEEPDSGARDGPESTELSYGPRRRRPLQGGVRERRPLAVTMNWLTTLKPHLLWHYWEKTHTNQNKQKKIFQDFCCWYSNISQLFSQFLVNITEHRKLNLSSKRFSQKKNVNEMYDCCFHKCFHSQLNISLGLSVVC